MSLPLTCVIPTHRPGPEFTAGARYLGEHLGHLIISDDASPAPSDRYLRECTSFALVVRHANRAGIARGLNDGVAAAESAGRPWLLTLDQDTQMSMEAITALVSFAEAHASALVNVGVVAPRTVRVGSEALTYPETMRDGLITTHEVFQSGALWNVSLLRSIGGFDESLGMDAVDAAACLRLRERGALVLLAPGVSIEHGWGRTEFRSLGGRRIAITHHDAARRSTIVRNRLRLAPAEFRQSPIHALRTLRRVATSTVLAAIVERDRWAKVRASASGIRGVRSR